MLQAPEDAANLSKMITEIHRFVALWIKKCGGGKVSKKNLLELLGYLHYL